MAKPFVNGITIYDANNQPLRLKGWNCEEIDLYNFSDSINWLKTNGFNYIRMMIMWHRYEPQQDQYDGTYLNALDQAISQCEANGIYVNLDFQQWGWSPYWSGVGLPTWLVDSYEQTTTGKTACVTDFYMNQGQGVFMRERYQMFWETLIDRYHNYDCIFAYELMNEPTILQGSVLTAETRLGIQNNFFEPLTPWFRSLDPETILIYHNIDFQPGSNNTQPNGVEHATQYQNIVWSRSFYDVQYGGYTQAELGEIQARIGNIKNKYNTICGTPFIVSEMGNLQSDFPPGSISVGHREEDAAAWARDTFNQMRSLQLNNGFESYAWYVYDVGPSHGYWTGRNSDGSNTFIPEVLKEYFMPTLAINSIPSGIPFTIRKL